MRIALPIWEDKISPVMDTASRLLVIERSKQEKCTRYETTFHARHIAHKTRIIVGLGVEILICGAISRSFENMLSAAGVRVVYGLSGPVEAVMDAYFEGSLDPARFLMPGFDTEQFKS